MALTGSNHATYNSTDVLNWYARLNGLLPVEHQVFEAAANDLAAARVLDIGIGGGRTTAYLESRAAAYTGIDYSQGFVTAVTAKFPQADIRLADARDLSDFEDNRFHLVNFSFNGMDYVDEAGREKILAEVQRVLKPGGLFFFSTHNKSHYSFNKIPWLNPSLSLWTRLKTFVKLLPYLPRHLVQKKNERFAPSYAIINDSAHNYQLLTFYTTPLFLKEQLSAHRFGHIHFFLKTGEEPADDRLEDWIFVTCKKSAP